MATRRTTESPPKSHAQDWHPADIVAALRKRGWSLRRLSVHHGYASGSLKKALCSPWSNAEHLIAEALDMTPDQIWPTRYADGTRPRVTWRRLVSTHSLAANAKPA